MDWRGVTMHNVVRLKRRGTKKADDSALKTYRFHRSYNARIVESGEGKFPNIDEAVQAAANAHMADFLDYTGKPLDLNEADTLEETVFPDVRWSVWVYDNGLKQIVKEASLRPGYVMSDDVQEIVTELAALDFDWPSHKRQIRALMDRARRIVKSQGVQNEFE